jgi:hypothetical protein
MSNINGGCFMQITLHAEKRMNQRGITREMIEFVRKYGDIKQDKIYINRSLACKKIKELEENLRIARQQFLSVDS